MSGNYYQRKGAKGRLREVRSLVLSRLIPIVIPRFGTSTYLNFKSIDGATIVRESLRE